MTKEEARKAAEIMLAYANGEEIESLCFGKYLPCEIPTFNWIDGEGLRNYRIKPKPKCRPFCTQEECWNEMHKHSDFGWIKDNDVYRPIIKIDKANIYYLEYGFKGTGITYSSFKESLELKFTDGTPFGIKEE